LGLNTNIGAFDMNLGCSGFVYGLGLAKGLIASGQAKNILFITSETYTKFLHPQDKSNKTIFGDAAAATLISLEGFGEILNFEYGTDGKGANNLIVKNGGLRNFKKTSIETIDEYNNTISDDYLYMNGPEIFAFTLSAVPALITNTLFKNNLKQEKIDLFILHQANQYILEHLRKKIKIDKEKFFVFMENCGNTVSSTIPIAVFEAQKQAKILKNQHILLAGFGVGYSWAGTVLKII
jgi:3-oxoacyl-[acyl-carrier-protein] synthase-3